MVSGSQKSVIVTGGSSGIGRAIAQRLAQEGHGVTIADINAEAGQRFAAGLKRAGLAGVQFVHADIADEASVQAMVDVAVKAFGRLDGAVNAAGIGPLRKALHELDAAEWSRNMAINLTGMFYCLKHQVRALLENTRGGSIVAVSSAAAVKGMVRTAEYSAGKAGITGIVRAAALDYAAQGIRINALLPGSTLTPMAAASRAGHPDAPVVGIPMGRMAEPSEIASMAAWLISDESSYVTGQCMAVDGGMTIG